MEDNKDCERKYATDLDSMIRLNRTLKAGANYNILEELYACIISVYIKKYSVSKHILHTT